MIRKRFRGICIALTMLSTMSLVACGSNNTTTPSSTKSPEEKVKLVYYQQYSNDDEKQPADYSIAALKKEMPNVEIEISMTPQDNDQKIKTLAASGELPDIMSISPALINLFSKSNNIIQLDKYVKDMGVSDKLQDGSKSLLIQGDGHTIAMPIAQSNFVQLFYNKDVFNKNGMKVPTNYGELLATIKAFKEKNITPIAFFAKEQWPAFSFMDALVTRNEPGGLKKIDLGKANITDQAYVDAAGKFYELSKAGMAVKSSFSTSYDEAYSIFTTGKSAMLLSGSWACKDLGDKMGDNVGLLPLTALADAKNVGSSAGSEVGGGFTGGLAVAANSKHKDIAAKAAIILALKHAEARTVKRGDPNSLLKAQIKPEVPFNNLQQEFIKTVMSSVKTYSSFYWGMDNTKISTAMGENIAKLMVGSTEYTPEKFIEETDKAIKQAR